MRTRPATPIRALLACMPFLIPALAPAFARAEVFTIALPVPATYTCGDGCLYAVIPFQLPGNPAVVRGASLHVTGTTEVGAIQCDDIPGSPPYPWTGRVEAVMHCTIDHCWDCMETMPTVSGPFDVTAEFRGSSYPGTPPVDWSFLSGGTAEVELYAGPEATLLGCFPTTPPPKVIVTGAWLLVDADIPVPAHPGSWGRVKAVYR